MYLIRIAKQIVNMTKCLYNGTTTNISINGKTFETFVIKKKGFDKVALWPHTYFILWGGT
jgi:hypothetical protein